MSSPGHHRRRGQRLRYRYHFADFVTGLPLATLPLRDAKLSEVLSGAADGTGGISLDDRRTLRHDPFRATIPRRTTCWAERIVLDAQNRVVSSTYPWAGVVTGRERSRSGRTLSLSMVSWAGYFQRRLVRDQTHENADLFAIFRALLSDACSWPQHIVQSRASADDLTDPFPLLWLWSENATQLSGVKGNRTYLESDLKPTLEELRSLAAAGAGFDWRMYPVRDPATGRFRVALALGFPRLGRVAPVDLIWSDDENDADAGQLLDYTITEDGQMTNNRIVALGEGQGPAQLRAEVWANAVGRDEWGDGYPLWESSLRGSTQELRTQENLDAHALGGMIAGLAAEVTLTGVTVRGDLAPELDRYTVGDDASFRIDATTTGRPTTIVGQIVARTIEPAQPGRSERVTLDLQGTAVA